MRDNKKMLITLAVILAVSLVLLCIMLFAGGEEPAGEESVKGYAVIRTLDADDISAFTLGEKTFEYTDRGWVYDSDPDFPLSADYIHEALSRLSLIDAVEVVAEGVNDLTPYGLNEAKLSLSVTADKEYTYIIGDRNPHNGFYYFMEEGGNTVFLVDADLPLLCRSEEGDFISRGKLPENFVTGTVKRVSVDGTDYTDEPLLTEVHGIKLRQCEKYPVTEDDLVGMAEVTLYYSAESEDSYGSYMHSLALKAKVDGDHILFTYGDDRILYSLECTAYPEFTKVIK